LENTEKDARLNIKITKTKTLLFGKTDIENQLSSEMKKLKMLQSLFTWVVSSLQKTTASYTELKEELIRLNEW